ncbi:PKD domain-containing protein [Halomicroarcula sp. F13]|uniref:PKD domain-containing protein n=1 Tax=Haloarcula rubra TaxID=2487747 RepID=A0AAW4PNN7_9EURY|nr:PKD domain-containing protein [Halomicroarcula rubra]MBX0322160.1 PKD domain-containing protein [Halomicroarcula rubra]
MRLHSLAAAALLAAALLSGTVVAAENAPPLADAGLDQTVPTNTTVYLDANGSRDPDGTVARVSWTVETPGGDTVSPDCRTCRQTKFRPTAAGQYNVTVSVTDDDGATRSDTLHVVASAPTTPTVSLTGPSTVARGDAVSFTAAAASTGPTLSTLAWVVDGNVTERTAVAVANASVRTTRVFDDAGTQSLRVVAYDALGRRGTATKRIVVVGGGVSQPASNSDSSGSGDSDCHFWENDCLTDVVLTNPRTGEKKIIEGDGESGTSIWVEGKPRDLNELLGSDLGDYRNPDGTLDYDKVMDDAVPAANRQDIGMDPDSDSNIGDGQSSDGPDNSNDYRYDGSTDTYNGGSPSDHYNGGSEDTTGSSDTGRSSIDHSDTTSDSGHTLTSGSGGSTTDTGSDASFGEDSTDASGSGLFAGGTSSGSNHDQIDDSSSSGGYDGGSPSNHYGSSGGSSDTGGDSSGGGCQYPDYPSLCG